MRLNRLWINGLRNLKNVEVNFAEDKLTTVIIGQNGAGKSNLIEAIVHIFRNTDLDTHTPPFEFELDYHIDNHKVSISGRQNKWSFKVDGKNISRQKFQDQKKDFFPDLIFGYYSGGNNRLESLFSAHQRRYYDKIKREEFKDLLTLEDRKLFYCRSIHGVLSLLSLLAFPSEEIDQLLNESLGVTGFHSAMVLLRKPWYADSTKNVDRKNPTKFWGATGLPAQCAKILQDSSFFPLIAHERILDDYRDKGGDEQQYCMYLRNTEALHEITQKFKSDLDTFEGFESMDISDLIRSIQVWVTRKDDDTGDVSFGDLSDGERQLLMVLGLIRLSRGKRTLFLLDEPDTHLNPAWQQGYLDLIQKWAQTDAQNCHFILTSHNPLTISALSKEEVRVMFKTESNQVKVEAPYADPRGMGFTATLTEIFGLSSSLDTETQKQIDERNALSVVDKRTKNQEKRLIEINDELNRLGFLNEDRDPLYQDFLRAWQDLRYANKPPLTPEKIALRHDAMQKLIKELTQQGNIT